MKKILLPAFMFVFIASAPLAFASGQNETSAQSKKSSVEAQNKLSQMGPVMGSMMEQMMAGVIDLMARPETAGKLAAFTWNYYEALVKKGFTKEEALRIVSSRSPMQGLLGK